MKRKVISTMAIFLVCFSVFAGCSRNTEQKADEKESTEVAQEAVEGQSTGGAQDAAEEQFTLAGVLEETKDFMFVVTDDAGTSYAFTFEEKPEGLDEVSIGDQVIVTYTGTISEVDPFTGEVLSVEKQ